VRRRGARARAAPRFAICPTPGMACGRDVPAPSTGPPPHPANLGRLDLSVSGAPMVDVGRTQHPKAVVVVAVVGMIVVTVVRARVVLIVVPGPAAQHARLGLGTPHRFPGDRRLPPWPSHVERRALPIAQSARIAVAGLENSRNRASRGTEDSGSVSSGQRTSAQRMGDAHNTRKPPSPLRLPG
jgi:hypothetical protein